jgi:hypothetical protein
MKIFLNSCFLCLNLDWTILRQSEEHRLCSSPNNLWFNHGKSFFGKMFSLPQKIEVKLVPAHADFGNAEVQFGMGLKCASSAGASQDYLQAAECIGSPPPRAIRMQTPRAPRWL